MDLRAGIRSFLAAASAEPAVEGLRGAGAEADEQPRLAAGSTADPGRRRGGPKAILDELLEQSSRQTSRDAEDALAVAVLGQLVPDEARILIHMGRRRWVPAVDVIVHPRSGQRGIECATLISREAGLALPACASSYVARLMGLGLISSAHLERGHDREFEILMAETAVLRTLKDGRKVGRGPEVRQYGIEVAHLGEIVLRTAGRHSR